MPRSSLDAYLSLSPPSKFKLMVATPWPCLFFATALYSPASPFATLSILSLARWYSFWSSSSSVLNRPPSFTSSVPWYLRSPSTCQVEATAGYWLASRVARSEVRTWRSRTSNHRNETRYRDHRDNRARHLEDICLRHLAIVMYFWLKKKFFWRQPFPEKNNSRDSFPSIYLLSILIFAFLPMIQQRPVINATSSRASRLSRPYHLTLGFGSPTSRHSKVMVLPSSDCLITGRSVKVGLIPSSGTGASSPTFDTNDRLVENCSYTRLLAYSILSLQRSDFRHA